MQELLSTISSTDVSETKSTNKKVKSKPTTFQDLLDGRRTIRKGQKGDVVRDIQRMLVTLGYTLGNTGPKGDGVDGDFGNKTKLAVENFQDNNDLKGIDGIVGEEAARFQANIMMTMEATKKEVQNKIDEVIMDAF